MIDLSPSSVNLIGQVINNPEDWDRYLVLADCLEEEGNDELAYTIRWMAQNHRCPQPIVIMPSEITYKYEYEWIHSRYIHKEYPLAHLAIEIWQEMVGSTISWKGYFSWLKAVMDLSSVLHTLLSQNEQRRTHSR